MINFRKNFIAESKTQMFLDSVTVFFDYACACKHGKNGTLVYELDCLLNKWIFKLETESYCCIVLIKDVKHFNLEIYEYYRQHQ